MEKWFLKNKQGDASALADALHISEILARIMINRNVGTKEQGLAYLKGGMEILHSPMLLKDCHKAAQILRAKIAEGRSVRIIGDYDCDGICATYILYRSLKTLGAEVSYCLPHRMKDGYGLSISMVQEAVADGVDTILTCDNGIAAIEQIAFAKERGLTVIVTDHHEVPFAEENGVKKPLLPPADAIVNMKQEDDAYPFKGICGATTAWKLCQLLLGSGHPVISELLPYVALATVCDVMDLVDENRELVRQGLYRIRTNPPMGLLALIQAYELTFKTVSAYHLGFLLGPCLNATGRLETAEYALKLLCMEDREQALVYAHELKSLNDVRKSLTKENSEQAIQEVKSLKRDKDKVIVTYLPDCHESLAGIIAGRIREQFHRPALVFTKAEEGVKASGRSVECYDMFQELSACKDLFTKFGGHKMAAGLSMAEESRIWELRDRLNANCKLREQDFIEKVYIDAAMPMACASIEIARELELLEPFGNGNNRPLFAERDLLLIAGRKLGAKGNAARFTVKDKSGNTSSVMLFGDLKPFCDFLDEKYGMGAGDKIFRYSCAYPVHMIYTLQVNSFQGREQVQLQLKYYC